MKPLQLKNKLATILFAAISFMACKKADVITADAAAAVAADSAAAQASRMHKSGGGGVIPAANTYYISLTGNDITGNGSKGNPWKTLYKATTTVSVIGDIIHVNAGTYTETSTCLLPVGVSIEGDGITSIIKSTLTADWQEILKLYSATEGTNGNQHIRNLKFDGQNLSTYWGINIVGRSNVEVDHITMADFKASGIFFDGRTDNTNLPPTVYSTGNSFHDNIVHNCAAYNLSTGEYGRGALNIGGQLGMLVYNNTMTQYERPDRYNGWLIKYSHNGYNKGLKIYNNSLTKKPFAGAYGGDGGWNFALELWFCEGGLEIYGNTIQGALDLVQVRKRSYPFGVWIHDNNISQPVQNNHTEEGLNFEIGVQSAIIENNVFNNLHTPILIQCEHYAPPTEWEPVNIIEDIIIRKNLCSNIGGLSGSNMVPSGAIFITADATTPFTLKNFNVYNNTFQASGATPWVGMYFAIGAAPGHIQSVNIRNNIIQGFPDSYFFCTNSVATWDTLTLTNNISYLNGNGNNPKINGIAPTISNTTSNIVANPLFVSPSNFNLQSTSPAIDAGVYVGIPYIGSAPDIGYVEY